MYGTTPNSIRMFFAEKYQAHDLVRFEQTEYRTIWHYASTEMSGRIA